MRLVEAIQVGSKQTWTWVVETQHGVEQCEHVVGVETAWYETVPQLQIQEQSLQLLQW